MTLSLPSLPSSDLPLRPHDHTQQIEPRRIEMPPAQPDHLAVHQHDLGAKHVVRGQPVFQAMRSEEHTSELQSLMRISYAIFCLKKKKKKKYRDRKTTINHKKTKAASYKQRV